MATIVLDSHPRRDSAQRRFSLPTLMGLAVAALAFFVGFFSRGLRTEEHSVVYAHAEASPGLEPYTPTKIEWLTLECQAALQDYSTLEGGGYAIDITSPDSETVLIYVAYRPNVIREAMNLAIDSARKTIAVSAKSHGWDKWVKIREKLVPANR